MKSANLGDFIKNVLLENELTFLDRDIITPIIIIDTKYVKVEKHNFNSLQDGIPITTDIIDLFNAHLRQNEVCRSRKEKSSLFLKRETALRILTQDLSNVTNCPDIFTKPWIFFPLDFTNCEWFSTCIINLQNFSVQFYSTEATEQSSTFNIYFQRIVDWLACEAGRNNFHLNKNEWTWQVIRQTAIDFKVHSYDVGVYMLFVNYMVMCGETIPQIEVQFLKAFRKFVAICIKNGKIFEFKDSSSGEISDGMSLLLHFALHAGES
jgi:hypothetical protein